jgi:uncharacterized protein YbaR (Trm112 family)
MNKKLLDILVCPFDKVSSLELFQFKSKANPDTLSPNTNTDDSESQNTLSTQKENDQITTDTTPSTKGPSVTEINKSPEIVEEGLLLCRACMRFYPITQEIPIILPDELRDKKKDLEFLKTWNESIPNDLLKNLKPWTTKI